MGEMTGERRNGKDEKNHPLKKGATLAEKKSLVI